MEYMQERREKEDADDQTGSWEKAPSNRKHDTRAEVAVIFLANIWILTAMATQAMMAKTSDSKYYTTPVTS
jgi:hypothetical protein